jgi:hypothetical protein
VKPTAVATVSSAAGAIWEHRYQFADGWAGTSSTYMSLNNGPFIHSYGGENDITKVGAPLPPGKIDFDTVISRPGISDADFARLMTIYDSISISGVIRYDDASGGSYETAFCLSRLLSGAIKYRLPSAN